MSISMNLGTGDVLGQQAVQHAAQAGALGTLECIFGRGVATRKANTMKSQPLESCLPMCVCACVSCH